MHGAWRRGQTAAVVLVNVDREAHRVLVPLDPSVLRLEPDTPLRVDVVESGERRTLGPLSGGVELELPPRRIVLLEIG